MSSKASSAISFAQIIATLLDSTSASKQKLPNSGPFLRNISQEITEELAQLVAEFGVSSRGLIGTVFRLGESISNNSWSPAAVAKQIKLAMEEKYSPL